MLLWIILILLVAVLAYVRLAPSDPDRWHKSANPVGTETLNRKGGYVWRKPVEGDGRAELEALAQAAEQTPRTERLAGSVADGQITYVTRSQLFGFPDYSTMGIYTTPEGERFVEVYARLRFGRSDLGVNAKRTKGWVAAAQL